MPRKTKSEPVKESFELSQDAIAFLESRRAASRAPLPSVINVPSGAYIATSLVAVAALAVVALRPGSLPTWLALIPAVLLLAGFTMKSIFGALMLYEGWRRWHHERTGDDE